MKLSSSASCGCCFCCYCRSWLMMLLMVSSVIHVSPEMTTTMTNTNLNNYYKAMAKSAKFNAKLTGRANRMETPTTTSPSVAHRGNDNDDNNNKQAYPTLQPDMATAPATMQTTYGRATTESSSPEQIAMTRQSLYETMPTLETEERRRNDQDLFYRLSTSDTPALNGDNYDVVIRTTDTTDSIESMETIGVAATRNIQITVHDGGNTINNDSNNKSKNLKYPRIESSASEEHKHRATTTTTTARTQNTEHVSGNHDSIHADYGTNQYHTNDNNNNNGGVQNTNIGRRTSATVVPSHPRTKQYKPNPTSTSASTSTKVIPSSSNNTSNIIEDMSNTRVPVSSHLQRTGSGLQLFEYNQLKRPALLASFSQALHRQTREAEEESIDKCRMFNEGDPEKSEFYSPDYPNVYPKNINCTRVLTAPKGQIIRLDFRNSFHIESKERCLFDYLEIRDGQYGFSNEIGRYCGTNFPPEVISKERYLWLHFHSDESIEYNGFTAVYQFVDKHRDAANTDLNCTIEKTGYEGFVNSSDVPKEIRDSIAVDKIPLDCIWNIRVEDKWRIHAKFIEFKLAKPNECLMNFLDIFPEETTIPRRMRSFCGSAGEAITSDSNVLNMRFFAEQAAANSTFSILFTAFRDGKCTPDEYDCEDTTCIAANLECNGRDNCKFQWDEQGCKTADEEQSEHMIIIITVFGLILGGMVVTFLVNCVRKIMHDQKIIREHIRQSKESKLDEMGRSSKARSRDNISIVTPRQKHSQTSLQILDDVSNRYYREMELQAKGNFKEKEPHHIMRHDMIIQTSLCGTDDSSTTTTAEQAAPTAEQQPGAVEMGCQTRDSLFANASLLRSKSKTPSVAGGQRGNGEGFPAPPRFSTFGYDAAQMAAEAPPPPPAAASGASTLSRRNIHLPQASMDAEHPPNQAHVAMMPPQQQHRHLHHRPSQEICHHHHQHQQQQQQQLQQQHKHPQPRHHQQHQQHLQEQHHHPAPATHITTMPVCSTTIVTAISTGSGAARSRDAAAPAGPAGAGGASKNKQSKLDESKLFIDIRNSAPDVIIMTSH